MSLFKCEKCYFLIEGYPCPVCRIMDKCYKDPVAEKKKAKETAAEKHPPWGKK